MSISVFMEKAEFTEQYLEPLMKRLAPDVVSVSYELQRNGSELVHIRYRTNAGIFKRSINVTADSLSALVRDVTKYC